MQSSYGERVRVEIEGARAVLSLTRGDKHNGVDLPMLRGMIAAQRALKKRKDVRVVILRGEGPSFCAGLDVKSMLAPSLKTVALASQLLWPRANLFQIWSMGWRTLGVPVLAAVHGSCFGAGLQLALGADLRFARVDAKLSIMEAQLGLVPDMGGPTLLRELLRIDVAKELTLTGRVLSGTDAHALGLVTHLADDPLQAAHTLADELEARSPDAVAAGKFLLQRAWGATEADALAHERRYQRLVIGRGNQRLAVSSRGKQAPTYAQRSVDS